MAAVSLFWDTNMAAVTSCEKHFTQKHGREDGKMVVCDKRDRDIS